MQTNATSDQTNAEMMLLIAMGYLFVMFLALNAGYTDLTMVCLTMTILCVLLHDYFSGDSAGGPTVDPPPARMSPLETGVSQETPVLLV